MGYAKYMEDNIKISQERKNSNVWTCDYPSRSEEYVPYVVRYRVPQRPKQRRKKTSIVCC